MKLENIVKYSFGASAPFNFGAALVLAFPASAAGQMVGLPAEVPLIYRLLVAMLVGLFGGIYAWVAMQSSVHRVIAAFSATGKATVFVMALALCLKGEVGLGLVALASGDLAFAALWIYWLARS